MKNQKSYTNDELYKALEESIKIQSHYAELLNIYDGGKRLCFSTIKDWLERLKVLEK